MLTIEDNALRRYTIASAGEVALVESGEARRGFFWSDCLGAASILIVLASAGTVFFMSDGLAIVGLLVGIATFLAHLILWGRTFARAAPTRNERWDRVGGPDGA